MTARRFAALIVLIGAVPSPAPAQHAHHDEVEVIAAPAVPDKSPTPDLAAAVEAVVKATGEFRKAEKVGAVTVDEKLKKAAQAFAEYMAQEDRYGHTADGHSPAERAKAQGYDYCIVLENIAYAFDSGGFAADKLADTFVDGWKKSPGHRKNMLDPDVTETVVGVARSAKTGYYYAVQMFGRPKSQAIEFKIENTGDATVSYRVGDKAFTLPVGYTRTHTVCRPPAVAFRWPGADKDADEVKPTAGQKLVAAKSGGTWAVRVE